MRKFELWGAQTRDFINTSMVLLPLSYQRHSGLEYFEVNIVLVFTLSISHHGQYVFSISKRRWYMKCVCVCVCVCMKDTDSWKWPEQASSGKVSNVIQSLRKHKWHVYLWFEFSCLVTWIMMWEFDLRDLASHTASITLVWCSNTRDTRNLHRGRRLVWHGCVYTHACIHICVHKHAYMGMFASLCP